jgi:hypothetical protein
MDANELVTHEQATSVRMQLKTNKSFRLDLLDGIADIARRYDVQIGQALLQELTLATQGELNRPLMGPGMPYMPGTDPWSEP